MLNDEKMISVNTAKPTEVHKSWKKINEERKALKKQRKQEKLLKELEKKQTLEKEKQEKELITTNTSSEKKPNPSTVSIAVPGSILENAQSVELRTYVAGQIARAACIYRVNEVIVFDDIGLATARETKRNYDADDDDAADDASHTVRSSCLQLARILQYLECPQYLRKFFFPLHKDLKYSGLLNPLDAPHHLRQQNIFRYREGIVTEKQAKPGHSYVNVGLLNDVLVNKALTAGLRVTVKLDDTKEHVRKQRGTIVSPDEPRRETGVYWGYTVRIAHTMSDIFTKSPYPGGYDLTIGTSDRGANVQEIPAKSLQFNHVLLVFGGLQGLESALSNDDKLQVDDPELLFDNYINVLPKQGSRTIRTEEAILIAMAAIQEKLNPQHEDVEEELIKEALPRSEDTGGIIPRPGETKMAKKRKRLEEKQAKITEVAETQIEQENPVQQIAEDMTAASEPVVKKEKKSKKNPFNKTEETSVSEANNDNNDNNDADFEVVPFVPKKIRNPFVKTEKIPVSKVNNYDDVIFGVVTAEKLKMNSPKNKMSDDDLSRFD
ncbi:putative methyltransferase C9orf114 [Lucilia cuprina]|uniref:putative methyltransferase C9orf114 n=1 Tax=Lucilia cuprina TaxID=7375 RepID=UPI001F06C352|nr:putative methyltransferase C9orf114 [Lucilia cuprina]